MKCNLHFLRLYCDYLLDNSDSEVVFFQSSYSETIKKIADKLPKIKAFIQVGGTDLLDLKNCYMYEEIISKNKRNYEEWLNFRKENIKSNKSILKLQNKDFLALKL